MRKRFVVWGTGIPKKKKEANSSSSSSSSCLSYNISIKDCSYAEPDDIKNKVSLYCVVVLIAYTTMKLR